MLRSRIAALVAAALLFSACDKPKSPPPAVSASSEPAALASASAAAQPSAAPSASVAAEANSAEPEAASSGSAEAAPKLADAKLKGGASVKLLSPGKEPRAKLRYELKPNTSDKLDFVTTTNLTMDVGGQKLKTPAMAPVRMLATLNVLDVDDAGVARRKLAVDKVSLLDGPGLDAKTKDQIETQLKGIEQLRVTDKLDSRGVVHSLHVETGNVADPQLKQLLGSMEQTFGQMGAPFPEEEVGVGAKWQIANRIEQMGFRIEQTTTYELVEFANKKGKIKLSLKQSAPPGDIKPPGMPAGTTAKLVSMKGSGKGDLAFNLEKSMPNGQIDTNSDIKLSMNAGDDNQESTIKAVAKVVFKRIGE